MLTIIIFTLKSKNNLLNEKYIFFLLAKNAILLQNKRKIMVQDITEI